MGNVVDANDQDVVAYQLGDAAGDLFDVQAKPDAPGAFAIALQVLLQLFVDCVEAASAAS